MNRSPNGPAVPGTLVLKKNGMKIVMNHWISP